MAINFFGISLGRTAAQPKSDESVDRRTFDPRRGDREIGATGTVAYAGFLGQDEYDSDLKGTKAIKVYERMMNDSQVQAMMLVFTLPMRSALPKFEPASDDEKDIEIAQTTEAALLNMKGQLWDDFIRQAFRGTLGYGHSVFETIFTDKDGKPNYVEANGRQVLAPYKLAPRLQKTLYRWHIDRNGDLLGVQQFVFVSTVAPETDVYAGDIGANPQLYSSGSWKFIDLPRDRIVYFGFDVEGANYLGRSILRAAYKNWYYKDVLLKISALAAERHGLGIPYAITKQNLPPREEAALINALRSLHAHEKQYLLVSEASLADGGNLGMPPIGIMDMRSQGTRRNNEDILYHDRQMSVSMLADFLTLGSQAVGSFAMHRDKRSAFYDALLGVKRPFEDAFQQQVVVPFVDLNYGPQKAYPKFGLTGLESKDSDSVSRAIALLTGAGLITPTAETEQDLRQEMDLPLLAVDKDGRAIYPSDEELAPAIRMRERARQESLDRMREQGKGGDPDDEEDPPKDLSERWHSYAEIPGAADADALEVQTAQRMKRNAARLADEEDEYDAEDFVSDSSNTLQNAMLAAFMVGAAALGRLPKSAGSQASLYASNAASNQRAYLEGFAEDIDNGNLSDAQIAARAAQYASTVWSSFQRGTVSAMPRQARIIWHAEGDATTCELCEARDGQEYTIDSLPGYPGDGDFGELCSGASNCRCWLEMID